MNESLQQCCGLTGRLFGHKFEPRYDESKRQATDILTQLKPSLDQAVQTRTIVLDNVCAALTNMMEAAASTESIYVEDVCVRCGLVIPKRSVTVAQPIPPAAPTPATPSVSPPPAPKVVVVPATPQNIQAALGSAKAVNPVRAVPGRGPKT